MSAPLPSTPCQPLGGCRSSTLTAGNKIAAPLAAARLEVALIPLVPLECALGLALSQPLQVTASPGCALFSSLLSRTPSDFLPLRPLVNPGSQRR